MSFASLIGALDSTSLRYTRKLHRRKLCIQASVFNLQMTHKSIMYGISFMGTSMGITDDEDPQQKHRFNSPRTFQREHERCSSSRSSQDENEMK